MFITIAALIGVSGACAWATTVDVKEREPSPSAKGEVYEWTSKEGLRFQYRIPKTYDADKGSSITFVFHGSNLDHRWGFANHSEKTFRPDDIVVCPDGTTPNGQGGFNFFGEKKDATLLHDLHESLIKTFRVDATYLYGHSQGSFFALYYAGEHPEEVNGVVAHASGVWTQTKQGKKGHHQAIVLMHGTKDPVVRYGQSVSGYESFAEKKYPMVRLRSLEGWNHWPSEENFGVHGQVIRHTSQQLAWCEGMTSTDADRVEEALAFLTDPSSKERHDYAAAYQVAVRIMSWDDATAASRKNAEKAIERIDDLAAKHAAAVALPKKIALDGKAWAGHAPIFLRAFAGVPACEEVRKQYQKVVDAQEKAAEKAFSSYWSARNKGDDAKAFEEGVGAIEECFLTSSCANSEFLSGMKELAGNAASLKLGKKPLSRWRAAIDRYEQGAEVGTKAFDDLNRKVGALR